eukprot:CAMPEP_0197462040 /NCGR_PEP_ID=MMETSP1175-20131217/58094_1 /TAXON_ID=1003142 /ORGANISM="Triceratium dubium, Strain CCMP147" /LENGTH=355 /DNA_ID=CAMNT_0042997451 /DNA_START=100 /DNA_END=1164 /DNA_ORIENTATION=+
MEEERPVSVKKKYHPSLDSTVRRRGFYNRNLRRDNSVKFSNRTNRDVLFVVSEEECTISRKVGAGAGIGGGIGMLGLNINVEGGREYQKLSREAHVFTIGAGHAPQRKPLSRDRTTYITALTQKCQGGNWTVVHFRNWPLNANDEKSFMFSQRFLEAAAVETLPDDDEASDTSRGSQDRKTHHDSMHALRTDSQEKYLLGEEVDELDYNKARKSKYLASTLEVGDNAFVRRSSGGTWRYAVLKGKTATSLSFVLSVNGQESTWLQKEQWESNVRCFDKKPVSDELSIGDELSSQKKNQTRCSKQLASNLRVGKWAYVKQSDGRWTYAMLAKKSEAELYFITTENGHSKSVLKEDW